MSDTFEGNHPPTIFPVSSNASFNPITGPAAASNGGNDLRTLSAAEAELSEQVLTAPGPAVPSHTWRVLSRGPKRDKLPKGLDAAWSRASAFVMSMVPRTSLYLRRAERVLAWEKRFKDLSDAWLREEAENARAMFRRERETPTQVERACAIIREVAARQLGQRPYREQVAAALAIANGCIAELATGEGKTLSATMPATLAGWRGRGCHVVTVNDYLAKRDAQAMRAVYHFCGLSVAHVDGEMKSLDRRNAYLADITYCTNKEVAADFLRDRLTLGPWRALPEILAGKLARGEAVKPERLVLRGLETAIIDEADSVLIDEAVTPLIISSEGRNAEETRSFEQACMLADKLTNGVDYKVEPRYREVELTPEGREKLNNFAQNLGGIWAGRRRREEMTLMALNAKELYQRGKQYVVRDDKIVIVDEFTGRLMPDRTWRHGLHQAVEAKERLKVQPAKETLARVSFQRFFRMYRKLGGMTGTAAESKAELWEIYKAPVVVIPTHRPIQRVETPDVIYPDSRSRWHAVVGEIKRVNAMGRPILVGTRSVEASEMLSEMLTREGLEHRVLNAVRHAEEAATVMVAGQRGRITVATNMAGRGTDIKPDKDVLELGGLHVIATERNESRRIDRQLYGRTGRQGDVGSAVAIISLEDELIRRHVPAWARPLLPKRDNASGGDGSAHGPVSLRGRWLVRLAQKRASRMALQQRRGVLRTDDWLNEFMGFAGREH